MDGIEDFRKYKIGQVAGPLGVSEDPSGRATENQEVERFGPSATADSLRWPFRHGSVAMSDFRQAEGFESTSKER
jgi:hypothetical protein